MTGIDLTSADLCEVQALATNFTEAILTGACIKDWNINNETIFDDVICDYVYLRRGRNERRPSDPNRNFEPGEFTKYIEKALNTVDLIFSDGIDWKAFLLSFSELQDRYGQENVGVQAIERKSGDAFVVRMEVPLDADKAKIEESFWRIYRPILQAKDEQLALYGQVLEDKRKENTRLIGIIETMGRQDDMSLNEFQISILEAINQGISTEKDISETLKLKQHLVHYYLEDFEDKNLL